MQITNEELSTIKEIVEQYNSLNTEFLTIQTQLETLNMQKDSLLSRLESVHDMEYQFFETLKNAYGEGSLNLETLEYTQSK